MDELQELLAELDRLLKPRDLDDPEGFLVEVNVYLERLEVWHQKIGVKLDAGDLSEALRDAMRPLVIELSEKHDRLVLLAEAEKEKVGQQIGGVHKKAKGMKAYIDRYPSRISITGKRKG